MKTREDALRLLAQLADLLVSPEFHPAQLDLERETMGFVPVSREAYRAFSFHSVPWIREHTPKAIHLSIDGLLRRFELADTPSDPLNFVLHPAFCASTLLSRALEAATPSLAFREPDALHQLTVQLAKDRGDPVAEVRLTALLRLLLHLLSRHYPDQAGTVIKPTDAASLSLMMLLHARPEAHGVYIYSDPESFVATAIKTEDRRAWLGQRARWLERSLFPDLPMQELPNHASPPSRIAVALWVGHARAVRDAANRMGSGTLRTLSTDVFFEDPVAVVEATARFFGLATRRGFAAGLAPVLREHAKLGVPYTSADRDQEIAALKRRHASTIADAIAWAEVTFGVEALATPLPAPLLH